MEQYLLAQLSSFFPDGEPNSFGGSINAAFARLERCMRGLKVPRFYPNDSLYFDHLDSEQIAIFIYFLSNECAKRSDALRRTATKLYLLNKLLHGLEAFYEIELPEVFYLAHPVGTVLGKAKYGNKIAIMQGCTIGNVDGKYPVFGENIVLCAHSILLGQCIVGDNVCFGAGAMLLNQTVPSCSTVVGRGVGLKVLPGENGLAGEFFV